MFGHKARRIAELEAVLRERDRQLELLRHDYEMLRADYTAVVTVVGGIAVRPRTKTLFDDDPFQEDKKQPDQWLSPGEDEAVDAESVIAKVESGEEG